MFSSVAHPLDLDLDEEVWVGGDGVRAERCVVCHNPDQADRDRFVRDRLVAHLARPPP